MFCESGTERTSHVDDQIVFQRNIFIFVLIAIMDTVVGVEPRPMKERDPAGDMLEKGVDSTAVSSP